MVDDEGTAVTDHQILDRIQAIGAIVVWRGPVEALDFATWRRELRRAAKTRGFRIAVNQIGERTVVISNPDHVVTEEQRRAAIQRMAAPPGLLEPAPRPALRLVNVQVNRAARRPLD